jgi:DNA-3-methyladenine glycosylase
VKPLQCCVERLRRAYLPVDTMELAQYLIGKTLVHDLPTGRLSGIIVEVEGYPPGDAAGHAFRGKTRSNQSLFLSRGYCYVYFTYGSSFMVNLTSEEPGVGAGVLLRALEPLQGIEMMQRFRKTTRMRDIARGPGRLAQAMQVDKRYDGVDLCAAGPLWLGTAARRIGPICSSTRIGLTREIHRERRFFESGSPYVSGPRSRSDTKWGSHGVPSSSPPIADPEQHHDDGYANRIND